MNKCLATLAICLSLLCTKALAQCVDVFSSGVSSFDPNGSVAFSFRSEVVDSGTELDVINVDSPPNAGNTCVTAACTSSGNASARLPLPDFEQSTSTNSVSLGFNASQTIPVADYNNISVGTFADLTFSGTGTTRINNLTAAFASEIRLTSGIYWIDELELGVLASIVLEPNANVVLFVNNLTTAFRSTINVEDGGESGQLLIAAYSSVVIGNRSEVNGFLFSEGSVSLVFRSEFRGAINAADIFMDNQSVVTYQPDQLNQLNSEGLCSVVAQEPEQLLFYQFEELAFAGNGSILDSIGSNNGSPVGNVSSILVGDAISCRALDVEQNTSVFNNDAADTNLDVNDIGEQGTISFWYRSNESWNSGNTRQLIDASLVQNPAQPSVNDLYFFANILSNGSVRFAFEDVTDGDFVATTAIQNFAQGEWVHLAFTWDLTAQTGQIYINGVASIVTIDSDLGSNTLGNLGTLFIGDNRTSLLVFGATANSANGQFEDLRVYRGVQSQSDIVADSNATTPCNGVAFYRIEHPAVGVTCEASQVTVTACADDSCSLFPSPVSISFPQGNGNRVSRTFSGSTTFDVSNSSPATLTLDIQAADIISTPLQTQQCTTNCEIEFREAAFIFVDQANGLSTSLPDIIAETPLNRIGLRAVRDNAGVCESALVGAQDVSLSFDCISEPSIPNSSSVCRVPFAGVPALNNNIGANTATVSLNFDANGIADLTGSYADAGRLLLSASGNFSDFSIDSGAGVNFDSIPAALQIAIPNSVNADNGATFVAGAAFDFAINAIGANGSTLPSYAPAQLQYSLQREIHDASLASNLESVLSLASNTSLVSAFLPTFTSVVTTLPFVDGEYSISNAQMSEVGSYALAFRDNSFLGNQVPSNTLRLGRFIPAYFNVLSNSPALSPSCSASFSYLGQDTEFEAGLEPEYIVTALNANGNITRLYSGSEWRLNAPGFNLNGLVNASDGSGIQVNAAPLSVSVDASGSITTLDNNGNFDGSGEIVIQSLVTRYDKPDTVDNALAPFMSDLSLLVPAGLFTDSDGVCYRPDYVDQNNTGSCQAFTIDNIGGAEQRYGRLRLLNTFGPETRPLRVPIQSEYLNNGNWLINTLDSCTDIAFSQVDGEITLSNASSPTEANIVAQYTAISSTGVLGRVSNGISTSTDLAFAAPLLGQRGSVRISLDPADDGASWAEFLNIDWDGDGDIDNDDFPSALVSFGLFRGNDRIFHSREVLGED